MREPQSAYGL